MNDMKKFGIEKAVGDEASYGTEGSIAWCFPMPCTCLTARDPELFDILAPCLHVYELAAVLKILDWKKL